MFGSRAPKETEATLVILSENPGSISEALAAEAHLGRYELEYVGVRAIRDQYFDTPEGTLGKRSYALRLRNSDGHLLLALKGGGEKAGEFATARLEIEGAWSQETLDLIVDKLQQQGVLRVRLQVGQQATQPGETLQELGFVLLQDRATTRQVFSVLATGAHARLAEIAVDEVIYHLACGAITHHELEVEVEATSEQGVAQLDKLIQALLARFQNTLRPWKHSKLATGLVLEKELTRPRKPGLWNKDGSLLPSTYDLIDERIRSKDPDSRHHLSNE